MTADRDDLEADLGSLTDAQWLADHQALIALGVLPDAETRFLYDPDRDPATVDPNELMYGGGVDGEQG